MLCIVAFPLFFVFYTVHMINEREKKKSWFRLENKAVVIADSELDHQAFWQDQVHGAK
jgi:hypothetical protein